MHTHLEIVMPPTEDVVAIVDKILAPFSENNENEDDHHLEKFWDWYQIGGRWSGSKYEARFDPKLIQEFRDWMVEEKITVSGIVFGKEELSPESQIPKVDKKWNEMFPSETFIPCPLFKHSGLELPNDIMRLGDMPERVTCARVIICAPKYDYDKDTATDDVEAEFMLSDSIYNGLNFIDTAWDKKVSTAVEMRKNFMKDAKEPYKTQMMPNDDWLVVTVDYHS